MRINYILCVNKTYTLHERV